MGSSPQGAYLVRSLLRLYDEVEITGAAGQFYEKFNIRYLISSLLKLVWASSPSHRRHLVGLSTEEDAHSEVFLRFSNLLINDLTYLMDEGLSKMASLEDPDPRTRSQSASIVRSCLQLAQESLSLLCALTTSIKGAFIRAELQDRLPAMLLLNMRTILQNTTTRSDLGWQPRAFISDILTIFEQMASEVRFVRAAALDARSFRKDILKECVQFVGVMDGDRAARIARLDKLLGRVHDDARSNNAKGGEGGPLAQEPEVPDEFLDPLTFSLMNNPVLLRTSNTVLDASTIKAHLLNDPHDPFNRKSVDQGKDIEPLTDLKKRIDEWKQTVNYRA